MKLICCTLAGIIGGPALAQVPPTDLIYGHFEFHLDYVPTPGNPDAGWRFAASYDEDDDFSTSNGVVRMLPASTVFVASPRSRMTVPSPPGIFGRFGPAGTPVWVLPQNQTLGSLYLGIRTTMPAGIFQASVGGNYSPSPQGSVSLRLISVTGTGPDAGGNFSTWKTESQGTTVFSFDTTNGITSADSIGTIPVSSHTHYNWGFTKPGTYHVTVEGKGKLMPLNGAVTSGRETFHFSVPFSSRIGTGAALRVVADQRPRLLAADLPASVAYAPGQVMLETVSATAASSALPASLWESSGTIASSAAPIANGVGVAPSLASSAMLPTDWTDLSLEIFSVEGPGNFAWISGGSILADGPGDVVPLVAGVSQDLVAAFTATGIYRIAALIHGTRQGIAVSSEPLTLVYGAGVPVDYNYAAWQSSFERAAGLPAGALADTEADYDRDGLANGVEFAFFWHGLNPAVSDARLMPDAGPGSEGFPAIDFLRDTYKDPLDETRWQIRPSASMNLKDWHPRSSRVPGFPFQIFETGAEEGNAHGRIMSRQLRFTPTPQSKGFFRFDVKRD
ncbi:choice-of-anchor M domain-containing protein [Luteolibacter sp. Populi]|uniref:choice-of-anchor M domain-containing protein n=1 Tax=Luteolibacter sp. Populi TaxID=3230487 RepID=UPI00346584F5